ncbi:hypothetical protein HMPREF1210_01375 [Paenisporosarcina sp. HGH0030]|uniref:hypothetical protein n=1 Tax=Paenisporosarcina sp. HGH0030 TaxID=1078085 RepID=UPI00034E4B14|nr:hypothetical protein [Paenisporosarcina sp. HGH0030]EPD52023.1 hypothetical protein HMPREF1210_01375 [Paenisporosarcina sp. HGH0030]
MKKFQKISAALLATGLVASTSFPAFANDTEKVDSSNFETVNLQEALNNLKEQTTSVEDLQTISTNIPLGYLANNIFALSLNIEKINNPTAKAALQRNIDKAIAKWEEKNKEEDKVEIPTTETTPSDEATEPAQTDEDTVENDKEKTETEKDSEVVKAEKKAAKEVKKAEKAVEKQERKDAQHAKQQGRKNTHHAKKEEHKASHHAKKEHRHEGEKHNEDHKNK